MTRQTRRGSREALADVYADLLPLIRNAARRYARRCGEDFDEAEAEATLIFLEAYHAHDPARSELPQRVDFLLARRLADRLRTWAKRNAKLPRVDAPLENRPARQPADAYSFGRLSGRVSPDARKILALLFDGPPEFDADVRADPRPGPESVRRLLRRHARRWGWTDARARAAMTEISEAI